MKWFRRRRPASPADLQELHDSLLERMDQTPAEPWQRREPFILDGAVTLTFGVNDVRW